MIRYICHSLSNLIRTTLLAMGLLSIIGLGGNVAWAIDDWQKPVSSDYQKTPPFITNATKPNIMIILDNSISMNEQAYTSGYTGEPYAGMKSFPVVSTFDDMEENSSGTLRDGSAGANDLDMGTDFVGIRFQDVAIPSGVVIEKAYLEFVADGNSVAGSLSELEIRGEAADDANFIDASNPFNISSRPLTAAAVRWNPPEFSHGETVVTEDITAIVQEIIDRGGWQSGNAMLFRIAGINFPGSSTGHRQVESSESGAGLAPVLRVHYGTTALTRYYGLFNPDYFYAMGSNTFEPKYKKLFYEYRNNRWQGQSLAGVRTTLDDTKIVNEQLWDGNWLNWASMRKIDVLRKVLMGGKGTSRQGGGNNEKEGEKTTQRTFARAFDTSAASDPAVSPFDGNYNYQIYNGDIVVRKPSGFNSYTTIATYKIDVQKLESIEPEDFFEGNTAGIFQRIGDRARWGNMWFNYQSGGLFQSTIAAATAASMASDLQNQACDSYTPLAETFYMAMLYFAQVDHNNKNFKDIPNANTNDDPYYDKGTKQFVPCAKSFVILLTDGLSTEDKDIPANLKDYDKDGKDTTFYDFNGSDYLDDVALYARTTDLRSASYGKTNLDGDQNLILYTVYAFGGDANARSLLRDAARNGGFDDSNNNGKPDLVSEWDKDGNGDPDTYFEASDGYALQDQLLAAINDIFNRAASGTAASVISNSRAGEGAVYQSIFFPSEGDSHGNTVEWMGRVQALLVDSHGNLREDTNQNKKLDLVDDLFIVYTDNPDPEKMVLKFRDDDGNGLLDLNEGADGDPSHIIQEGGIKDIKFLWSSSPWLNEISNINITQQRTYTATSQQRYIFTFADANNNMVADPGEVQPFEATSDPSWTVVNSADNFQAYLHPYSPYNPPLDAKNADGTDNLNFQAMVQRQVKRIINYVRGQDQGVDIAGGVSLAAFRSRRMDYDEDGIVETWRLGDIVYSTPTVVGRPAENYDLIYRDEGYADFYRQYKNRRNVVYVGANDGMLHAFNAGFYDQEDNEFPTRPEDGTVIIAQPDGSAYIDFEIGSELWAYVPYNLLAHLHWLANPDYGHVYYVDLQPRIFDAKIFPDTGSTGDHPHGWGTLLVGGMRFGGGKIAADIVKDGSAYDPNTDKALSSAYFILDITNPEKPPVLLAEFSFPNMGFTTCFPGVVPMRDFQTGFTENANEWYLFVGSGPIGSDLHYNAADPKSAQFAAERVSLTDGTSSQQARLYAIDLKALVANQVLATVTPSGSKTFDKDQPNDAYQLVQLPEAQSSISRPISIDWNLDFNVDVVYFGSSYGDHTNGWNGRMRRIVMDNDNAGGPNPLSPSTWITNNTLIEPVSGQNGQPIMAPANAGLDKSGNRWVFFGTGRYFSTADSLNTTQQSYYGITEPFTENNGQMEFAYTGTITRPRLKDVTNIGVFENGLYMSNYTGTFDDLVNEIDANYDGWVMDFDYQPAGERNLGQAVLAGDLLTFTTYIPDADVCDIGGQSLVYGLYYRTGTAYKKSIFGLDTTQTDADGNALVLKVSDLGMGLTITPNIHVGREDGSKAYIQTSTGAIQEIEQANPGVVKSGKMSWTPDNQSCP